MLSDAPCVKPCQSVRSVIDRHPRLRHTVHTSSILICGQKILRVRRIHTDTSVPLFIRSLYMRCYSSSPFVCLDMPSYVTVSSSSLEWIITLIRISSCFILIRCLRNVLKVKVKLYSSPEQVISELRGVTYHMGSHSVTCNPTQVNTPSLTQPDRPVLDLPTPEGWKAELT